MGFMRLLCARVYTGRRKAEEGGHSNSVAFFFSRQFHLTFNKANKFST